MFVPARRIYFSPERFAPENIKVGDKFSTDSGMGGSYTYVFTGRVMAHSSVPEGILFEFKQEHPEKDVNGRLSQWSREEMCEQFFFLHAQETCFADMKRTDPNACVDVNRFAIKWACKDAFLRCRRDGHDVVLVSIRSGTIGRGTPIGYVRASSFEDLNDDACESRSEDFADWVRSRTENRDATFLVETGKALSGTRWADIAPGLEFSAPQSSEDQAQIGESLPQHQSTLARGKKRR